ncbi:MAG: hypothetical protein R8P61_14315 [Bacteroidia bacterium]|nr:hypothetical protein [Bacteroidia bacterium]
MRAFILRNTAVSLLLLLSLAFLQAQGVRMIQNEHHGDSSYYDISEIAPGRFWMAGENGLLNEIDDEGNLTRIAFPEPDLDILRIVSNDEKVFVGTNHGGLFSYDLRTEKWLKAVVPDNFEKRCFYDLLLLPNQNRLMVSGGHQKIAKGIKTVPLGFIASIDLEFFEELNIHHKNSLSFVWSLEHAEGKIYAASFGGRNTKIMQASELDLEFSKQSVVPGLIHHLEEAGGSIFYSGTASSKYSQHGIIGMLGGPHEKLDGYGCIWSIKRLGGGWLGLNYYGDVLFLSESLEVDSKLSVTKNSIYEFQPINEHQALMVGHGQKSMMLDLHMDKNRLSVKN